MQFFIMSWGWKCVAILEVLSHVAAVNLSDFLQSHPLWNHGKNGRPCIHGNTLSQHIRGKKG